MPDRSGRPLDGGHRPGACGRAARPGGEHRCRAGAWRDPRLPRRRGGWLGPPPPRGPPAPGLRRPGSNTGRRDARRGFPSGNAGAGHPDRRRSPGGSPAHRGPAPQPAGARRRVSHPCGPTASGDGRRSPADPRRAPPARGRPARGHRRGGELPADVRSVPAICGGVRSAGRRLRAGPRALRDGGDARDEQPAAGRPAGAGARPPPLPTLGRSRRREPLPGRARDRAHRAGRGADRAGALRPGALAAPGTGSQPLLRGADRQRDGHRLREPRGRAGGDRPVHRGDGVRAPGWRPDRLRGGAEESRGPVPVARRDGARASGSSRRPGPLPRAGKASGGGPRRVRDRHRLAGPEALRRGVTIVPARAAAAGAGGERAIRRAGPQPHGAGPARPGAVPRGNQPARRGAPPDRGRGRPAHRRHHPIEPGPRPRRDRAARRGPRGLPAGLLHPPAAGRPFPRGSLRLPPRRSGARAWSPAGGAGARARRHPEHRGDAWSDPGSLRALVVDRRRTSTVRAAGRGAPGPAFPRAREGVGRGRARGQRIGPGEDPARGADRRPRRREVRRGPGAPHCQQAARRARRAGTPGAQVRSRARASERGGRPARARARGGANRA